MTFRLVCIAAASVVVQSTVAAPYQELVPGFNRLTSNAMVRKIARPTLANLDYAAYDRNPILVESEAAKPKAPSKPVALADITFGGGLTDVKNTIAETPLSAAEQDQPLAWRPLIKKLWEVVKDQGMQNAGSAINSYKWADKDVYQAYQDVTTAYLHDNKGTTEVWVKVEFSPWVGFLKVVTDEDRDGVKEIYGKLNLTSVAPDSLKKAFDWIRGEYTVRVQSSEGMTDWITDLASYWYPTKNTDVIDMTGQDVWPNAQTKKVVLKTLKGLVVKHPLAVVEGKPVSPDQPIYNVYVVDNVPAPASAPAAQQPQPVAAPAAGGRDTTVSQNWKDNENRWAEELKQHGGDWTKWAQENAPFRTDAAASIGKLPGAQMGYKGKQDWVFFRKDIDYLNGGDLAVQAPGKNPIPSLVEFRKFLADRGISLLFVPVPNKSEVYFDKLPVGTAPKDAMTVVNPYSRKFLQEAQAAGIEVIDLLPLFLKAKADDAAHKESVYQKQDTHWTDRGLEIAAKAIGDRIKQYRWYGDVAAKSVQFCLKDTTFSRQGDIVDKLPETDRAAYPAVMLKASQVTLPDSSRFKPSHPDSPVMLIGDSFTGVFELVDCKSAGVGAHISANTGIPVDIITSWGGGPLVRDKMLNAREKNLPSKKLVIYMMVARDLYNYGEGWAPLQSDNTGKK